MTVEELRQQLAGLPGDREIMMAADAEGNSFHPLSDVNTDDTVYDEWAGHEVRGVVLWP